MAMAAYGVSIFLFLALAVIGFSGCAGVNQPGQSQEVSVKSQSQEVKAFFAAGNEAALPGDSSITLPAMWIYPPILSRWGSSILEPSGSMS